MVGDHPLLVSRYDVSCNPARLGVDAGVDAPTAVAVGVLVDEHAQPGAARADTGAYGWRVLADTRRKHEDIDPAQRRGHRADLAGDAEHEEVHGLARMRLAGRKQGAISLEMPDTPNSPLR